jgi:hypothetical protein
VIFVACYEFRTVVAADEEPEEACDEDEQDKCTDGGSYYRSSGEVVSV